MKNKTEETKEVLFEVINNLKATQICLGETLYNIIEMLQELQERVDKLEGKVDTQD